VTSAPLHTSKPPGPARSVATALDTTGEENPGSTDLTLQCRNNEETTMTETDNTVTPAPVTPENPDPAIPAQAELPDPRSAGKEYRKTATVWAVQMAQDFEVQTLEGTHRGRAGDWLAQGPAGERWPIKREIFEATYEPVAETPDAPG
jgi:hypothetical protein